MIQQGGYFFITVSECGNTQLMNIGQTIVDDRSVLNSTLYGGFGQISFVFKVA